MVEFDIYFMIRTAFPRAVVMDVYGVAWAKYFLENFWRCSEVLFWLLLKIALEEVFDSFYMV